MKSKKRIVAPPPRKIFRVLLNPVLHDLEVTAGEIITCHGCHIRVNVEKSGDLTEVFVRQIVCPTVVENLGFKTESATTASAVSCHGGDQQMDTDADDATSLAGSVN